MTDITEERLRDDGDAYNKMQSLRYIQAKRPLTREEQEQLDKVFRKYYIDNDDIRMYWQGR